MRQLLGLCQFFPHVSAIDKFPWPNENAVARGAVALSYFRVSQERLRFPRVEVRPYNQNSDYLTEHLMNAMRAIPLIDAQPVLDLIKQKGECSFDEAVRVLVERRFSESGARDALWQFLSDGRVQFTPDRKLTVPKPDESNQTAGQGNRR
jgi:hypothetical protein